MERLNFILLLKLMEKFICSALIRTSVVASQQTHNKTHSNKREKSGRKVGQQWGRSNRAVQDLKFNVKRVIKKEVLKIQFKHPLSLKNKSLKVISKKDTDVAGCSSSGRSSGSWRALIANAFILTCPRTACSCFWS